MSNDKTQSRKHAIVIGGSLAGLFAARILNDFYERVTILERDPVNDSPEARKGQPQARQGHALLAQGFEIIKQLFPGIDETLVEGGATVDDMGAAIRWYQLGGYKSQHKSQLIGIVTDRLRLEWQLRRRVIALPGVTYQSTHAVKQLKLSPDQTAVEGVIVSNRERPNPEETILADLIIDATGRGSLTSKWLQKHGYEPPQEESVHIDLGYASRTYRRCPNDLVGAKMVIIFPEPPHETRVGFMQPIEDNRWMVTVAGWGGDHPPRDEAGFLDFVRHLPSKDISDVIETAEPLSDVVTYNFTGSLRRRYERLARFPDNFLVIGDAVASFTPVYGQGITSAVMQAKALEQQLRKHTDASNIRRSYFKQVAAVVDIPWQLAVGEDFRFSQTEGKRPFGTDLINAYVSKVHKSSLHDPIVYGQFLRVMNLLAPPTSLMQPHILWRVLGPSSVTNNKVAQNL